MSGGTMRRVSFCSVVRSPTAAWTTPAGGIFVTAHPLSGCQPY
jgi:hypothetical protein